MCVPPHGSCGRRGPRRPRRWLGKWHALATTLPSIDIANVALFLASDEAKGVSGAVVTPDGGWTAH